MARRRGRDGAVSSFRRWLRRRSLGQRYGVQLAVRRRTGGRVLRGRSPGDPDGPGDRGGPCRSFHASRLRRRVDCRGRTDSSRRTRGGGPWSSRASTAGRILGLVGFQGRGRAEPPAHLVPGDHGGLVVVHRVGSPGRSVGGPRFPAHDRRRDPVGGPEGGGRLQSRPRRACPGRSCSLDLVEPVDLEVASDGRIFFIERSGAVKVYDDHRGRTPCAQARRLHRQRTRG